METPNPNPNPNCEEEEDQFESALSSVVSSPVGIPISGGGVIRELIGRLGSICNSSCCYTTPLNSSPQKLINLSITDDQIPGNHQLPFPTDPDRFSTFGSKNAVKEFIISIPEEENKKLGDSMEAETTGMKANGRKRKGIPKGKGKDDQVVAEATAEKEDSDAKRRSNKSTEPPKDYIHVRARRGQATDSHSLAERVRREKISERMKLLQDLVPGCNKVTGKAVMLDEIINYVQSLQRQVEFLSMKLATVNPRMDVSMEALLSKDMFQPLVSMPNKVNPFDASVQPFSYGFQSQMIGIVPDGPENQFSINPLMAAMHHNSIMKLPHIDAFGEASTLWENDLQSVVKMAIGQDPPEGFHGQMKVEL